MEVTMRNEIATPTLESLTENAVKYLDFTERDDKMVLVIEASAATTLTIKAGNGLQAVNDHTVNVPKGISLMKLESGRFKLVNGENKGKIAVVSPGTPKVAVVSLI